jgi:OCT family organic cation transporter-like MFS transporter 4/5
MSLNVASFAGSVYINNAINGALEFPAYFVVAISVDKFGRRLTNSGFMIGGGIACLGCMALEEAARNSDDPASLLEIQRWMAFTGKFFISGSFGTTYLHATELFPTPLRSTGLGFGSMTGRIGAIVSPFIIQIKNGSIIYSVNNNTQFYKGFFLDIRFCWTYWWSPYFRPA